MDAVVLNATLFFMLLFLPCPSNDEFEIYAWSQVSSTQGYN